MNLILDAKAKIRFVFWNYITDDEILILHEKATINKFLDFLEKNIFTEEVIISTPAKPNAILLSRSGWLLDDQEKNKDKEKAKEAKQAQQAQPQFAEFLEKIGLEKLGLENLQTDELKSYRGDSQKVWIIKSDFTFYDDYLVLGAAADLEKLLRSGNLNLSHLNVEPGDGGEFLNFFAEKSKWVFYSQLNEEVSVLNTSWYKNGAGKKGVSQTVSLTKGCYPGQEIIARFHSREREMPTKLMMLKVDFPDSPLGVSSQNPRGRGAATKPTLTEQIEYMKKESEKLGPEKITLEKISFSEKNSFKVLSVYFSPTFNKLLVLGLANLKGLTLGSQISLENKFYNFELLNLPLSIEKGVEENNSHKKVGGEYYDLGLEFFHQDNIPAAKENFKKALEYNLKDEAALEALAMCEEKSNNLDEAIALNEKMAEIDDKAIMPHTNLSRLYMLQGRIEEAENESKKATVLMFKNASRSGGSASSTRVSNKVERQIKFFQGILDEVGDDDIAHYQLGKIYYEIKNFTAAEHHLQKVLVINPKHSLSYYYLALVFREQKKLDDYRKTLDEGKKVAEANGDFTPLKKINYLLEQL